MKSSILIFILLLSTKFMVGQDDSTASRLKPVNKDWGLTFNLNGLVNDLKLSGKSDPEGNPILFFRRYIKDDLAIRVGLGYHMLRNKVIRKDSIFTPPAFVEFDSLYRRNVLSVSIGAEKHFGKSRRIDPYLGAEMRLRFIGREQISWNSLITETTGTTSIQGERKTDGGNGFGLVGIAGVNYFITKNISIGGEYYIGYDYIKMGGNVSDSEIITPPTGSSTSTFLKSTSQQSNSTFGVNATANLILSIFF